MGIKLKTDFSFADSVIILAYIIFSEEKLHANVYHCIIKVDKDFLEVPTFKVSKCNGNQENWANLEILLDN